MKLKKTKKKNPNARHYQKAVRVSADELGMLMAKAESYTDGNLAEYLRYAALHFKPSTKDFE